MSDLDDDFGKCEICGEGIRWGSRHPACTDEVLNCEHVHNSYNSKELHCFDCKATWKLEDIYKKMVDIKQNAILDDLKFEIVHEWPGKYN